MFYVVLPATAMIKLATSNKIKRKNRKSGRKLLKSRRKTGHGKIGKSRSRKEAKKWKFLEHNGPLFAPKYKPLPSGVHFRYNGKPMKLRKETEEVMTYYAKLRNQKPAEKKCFIKNFFKDWRSVMSHREKKRITDFNLCDFEEVYQYFAMLARPRSGSRIQHQNGQRGQLELAHSYCVWDGRQEKLNNFRVEPPGLFIGRGNHPKMGKLKRRILPEDVVINCSRDSAVPVPPSGHNWKEVQHKDSVKWLASWTDCISGMQKYIMPNYSSKVMIRSDMEKFETARQLKRCVRTIRSRYTADMQCDNPLFRQLAVAIYFIDKLALRAGNGKEGNETADTVGCCSLRCKHVRLQQKWHKKEYLVRLDFLGKDCIPYHKQIQVSKQVYDNLKEFKENKRNRDRLFHLLNTVILNQYLDSFMKRLTAKVFRTYNASITLQNILRKVSKGSHKDDPSKVLAYNKANREVALLCNHQRAPPKNHKQQVSRIKKKLRMKYEEIRRCRLEMRRSRAGLKRHSKTNGFFAKKRKVQHLQKQFAKLKLRVTDKVENRKVALTTSKLNYIDPRISVAWCLKNRVPLDKVYSKAQREKFSWAIATTSKNFMF